MQEEPLQHFLHLIMQYVWHFGVEREADHAPVRPVVMGEMSPDDVADLRLRYADLLRQAYDALPQKWRDSEGALHGRVADFLLDLPEIMPLFGAGQIVDLAGAALRVAQGDIPSDIAPKYQILKRKRAMALSENFLPRG